MQNPNDFPEPESFNPERFYEDGQFQAYLIKTHTSMIIRTKSHDEKMTKYVQKNAKVCPFSLGNRNCVGKRLAEIEYFTFAAQIIHKLKITSNEPIDLEPISQPFLLTPRDTKLVFMER